MPGTHRLSGIRSLGDTVEFEDGIVLITYPTPTSWEADIVLEPEVTEYNYRLVSRAGVEYPWQTAVIVDKSSKPYVASAKNTIDLWGARLDTDRLPGESNVAYRDRLLDVFVHRGGADHQGLLNAITRDLDLTSYDQALVIEAANSPVTGRRFDSVYFGISNKYVRVYHPDLYVHGEKAYVDPVTRLVTPANYIAFGLKVTAVDGSELDYDYDHLNNRLYLPTGSGGQEVLLDYFYMHVVSRTGKTVQELATELEALETPAGDQLLSITVDADAAAQTAEKLQRIPEHVIPIYSDDSAGEEVEGLAVKWSDLKIEPVWEPELHESVRTWTGSLWNTKIDSAFVSLVDVAKQTWGTAVADDSVWGSTDFPLHGGQHIDCTYDAPLGYWENPITGDRYDSWQAYLGTDPVTGDTLVYKGILRSDYQSGIGSGLDLRVSLSRHGDPVTRATGDHYASDGAEGDIPTDDPMLGIVDLE